MRLSPKHLAAAVCASLLGLLALAAPASADTVHNRLCSSGAEGAVCTQVVEGSNGIYAYAAADTSGLSSEICIDHVALYQNGTLVRSYDYTWCADGTHVALTTGSASYPTCPRSVSVSYVAAMQYRVNGRAEERLATTPWKFTC